MTWISRIGMVPSSLASTPPASPLAGAGLLVGTTAGAIVGAGVGAEVGLGGAAATDGRSVGAGVGGVKPRTCREAPVLAVGLAEQEMVARTTAAVSIRETNGRDRRCGRIGPENIFTIPRCLCR